MDRSEEALRLLSPGRCELLARGGQVQYGKLGWETRPDPESSPQNSCAHRSERETAARISQEIGNLMKEIETLVEEKTKESLDVSRLTREGERTELRVLQLSWRQQGSCPTLADVPSSR